MSSLCQHILYPNINVTEYNQGSEQRGTALQPNVPYSYSHSSHGSASTPKVTNFAHFSQLYVK